MKGRRKEMIIINAIVQLVLFSALPYVYWRGIKGKKQDFFTWLGFKGIRTKSRRGLVELIIAIGSGLIFITFTSVFLIPQLLEDGVLLATSQFSNYKIGTIFSIIIYAVIQTGLSEEILFRGFLGKFFMRILGYFQGNIIQAGLFGIMHLVLFLGKVSSLNLVLIAVLTGSIGYFMGYINERKAGGSILPSWIAHSLANIVSAILMIWLF